MKPCCDDAENPQECVACQFETTDVSDYGYAREGDHTRHHLPKERAHKWLCLLCAATPSGNAVEYPEQYPYVSTMRTICYVGNVILAALDRERGRR